MTNTAPPRLSVEHLDGLDEYGGPDASLNHYSTGAVVSFLYRYTPGIGNLLSAAAREAMLAAGPARAAEVSQRLRGGRPRVFCLDTFIHQGILVVETPTLRRDEAAVVVERLAAECDREKGQTL